MGSAFAAEIEASNQEGATSDREQKLLYRLPDASWTGPDTPDVSYAEGPPLLLYLNRCEGDCTITYSAQDDSRADRSAIPDYPTVTLTEFNKSEADWQEIVSCTRGLFSRYNFKIVTEDPGNESHIEAMVAGRPEQMLKPSQDIPDPSKVGGIALLGCGGGIPNSIAYVYANSLNNNEFICGAIGQEIAHTFGLDHQLLCSDPMTYLPYCGPKDFQDTDAICGEAEPRSCTCTGSSTQNSHSFIAGRYGLDQPPAVNILSLSEGDLVAPEQVIEVSAEDNGGIERVEVKIADQDLGSSNAPPYEFVVPLGLPPGPAILEVNAYDDRMVSTTTQLSIEIVECMGPEHCASGDCVENSCPEGAKPDPDNEADPAPGANIVGGCSSAPAPTSALPLLLLALLSLGRKRPRFRDNLPR
jgi:uncharacterized protein (TIGR03382 family)